MSNYVKNNRYYSIIVIFSLFIVLSFGVLFAHFTHMRELPKKPAGSDIVVVSAPENLLVPHSIGGIENQSAMSPLPELSSESIKQTLPRYLPFLQGVRSECSTDVCTVTASAMQPTSGFDQDSFEHIITDEIPSAVLRSGYRLAEPVQIEEVGPDDYRVTMRIASKINP